MRLERDGDRRGAERLRARHRGIDHRAMAAVDTIEISDCGDRAFERCGARCVVVDDTESLRRLGRLGHVPG